MLQALEKTTQLINRFSEQIGRGVAWLCVALILLICYDVMMRALTDQTATWIIELEWHLFSLIFLFGGAYALKHDRHVRVDLFYANFSKRDKAWVNFAGTLFFLIPWCLVLIYFSYQFAFTSYEVGEGSPNPNGLPARYLIKFSICLGTIFLLLQAISMLLTALLTILHPTNSDSPAE
ncbi:MAG: TRAP transporter small permease subunit [Saprospiraceae bacterium]